MSTNTDQSTIAVIFDFDDTVAPDSTTHLLKSHDVDIREFWMDRFPTRVRKGYDPTIAYQSLLLDCIGQDKPLEGLSNDDLREVGESLGEEIFPGFRDLLDDFDDIASGYPNVNIETYLISEGLQSIIDGTEISNQFEAVYASELAEEDGVLSEVKRTISFTDKTRYIFEINKGISPEDARNNPYAVNNKVEKSERPVPFENMIYVGDGLTDIPCFSLVKGRGGRVFGVFDTDSQSAKQEAIRDIGSPQRTLGNVNAPRYNEGERLGSLLRLTVEGMCANRTIAGLEALQN